MVLNLKFISPVLCKYFIITLNYHKQMNQQLLYSKPFVYFVLNPYIYQNFIVMANARAQSKAIRLLISDKNLISYMELLCTLSISISIYIRTYRCYERKRVVKYIEITFKNEMYDVRVHMCARALFAHTVTSYQ